MYYDEKKDSKSSLAQYYDVIQNFPSSVSSADASYKIAGYFETRNDYLNAFKYYRFSTEQNSAGTYNREAAQKVNSFKRYFELKSIINGAAINTDYDDDFKKKTTKNFDKLNDPNKLPNKNGDNGKSGGLGSFMFADSLLSSDSILVVQPDTSHETERKIAAAKFELAELFLYDFNRTDSCEFYLKEALNESVDYDFNAKVLFALSALYRKLDDNTKSDEVLNIIVKDYPRSTVANSSRKLLNMSMVDEYSGDPGDSLYSAAETNFINKNYTGALDDFRSIITIYPSSVHIDKAYYGAGWIYENVLYKNDSAYYYYSSLVKGIPNSEAAAMVMQKVEEYETFNKTNVIDTTGINNTPPEEKKNENPGNNSEGNIDPLLLQKEAEQNIQPNSDPLKNEVEQKLEELNPKEENPSQFDPGKDTQQPEEKQNEPTQITPENQTPVEGDK